MRYILLIYMDEDVEARRSEAEQAAISQGYFEFTDEVRRNGTFDAGEPLQPTATATTVRVRNGSTLTTDGPYAETKEQLGGFYILDCENLDEAIALAAKIPAAVDGSIEIRPIMEISEAKNSNNTQAQHAAQPASS